MYIYKESIQDAAQFEHWCWHEFIYGESWIDCIFVKEVLLKNIAYLVFSATACFPQKNLNLKLSETQFLALWDIYD